MNSHPIESLDRKSITIEPTYLLSISGIVQILNQFHEQQNLGSLTSLFKRHLQQSFTTLGQSLYMWQHSKCLTHSAVLKAKVDVQMFCWQKLGHLMSRQSKELGRVITQLSALSRQHFQDYEKVVIQERKNRLLDGNVQKQHSIKNLKHQIVIQSDHIKDIQSRLREVEQENSGLYEKLIMKAKNNIEASMSPSKQKASQIASFPKIKEPINSHKTLTSKQVQEVIFDVMETKSKQEAVKGKKVSLNTFLTTYFRYKFGMRELAEQAQSSFRDSLEFFAKSTEKNIFILFRSILKEQCNQFYFNESKGYYDKIAKCVKRYINTKNGTDVDELDRIYDSKIVEERYDIQLNEKDINLILSNIYGAEQVDTLQSIFAEILASRREDSYETVTQVPSKKIINEILNYELKKYLLSIQDIIRTMKEVDTQGKGYYSYAELETLALKLGLSNEKINILSQYYDQLKGKFLTSSEVIELILKLRKTKPKRKN